LQARYVIHAVGPVWQGGNAGEAAVLATGYEAAMCLAVDCECKSIAFPAISCGVYGYPWEEAAKVSIVAVRGFLQKDTSIDLVRWVLLGDRIFDTWRKCWAELSGKVDGNEKAGSQHHH
jgi:O-acetyl-ADP-ribose deacetylase (regulator of RNase III)